MHSPVSPPTAYSRVPRLAPERDAPGSVVVLSNGDDGEKVNGLGENYGNKTWRDFLGNREETVTTAAEGEGTRFWKGGSVSVWVTEEAL